MSYSFTKVNTIKPYHIDPIETLSDTDSDYPLKCGMGYIFPSKSHEKVKIATIKQTKIKQTKINGISSNSNITICHKL